VLCNYDTLSFGLNNIVNQNLLSCSTGSSLPVYAGKWFKFYGTGDSVHFNMSTSINALEVQLYSGSCNVPVCVDFLPQLPGNQTLALKTIPDEEYLILLSTPTNPMDEVELQSQSLYQLHMDCICADLPLVYDSPNDFYGFSQSIIETDNSISASNRIYDGSDIIYDGKTYVLLNPNFAVELGSAFEVLIDGCN